MIEIIFRMIFLYCFGCYMIVTMQIIKDKFDLFSYGFHYLIIPLILSPIYYILKLKNN